MTSTEKEPIKILPPMGILSLQLGATTNQISKQVVKPDSIFNLPMLTASSNVFRFISPDGNKRYSHIGNATISDTCKSLGLAASAKVPLESVAIEAKYACDQTLAEHNRKETESFYISYLFTGGQMKMLLGVAEDELVACLKPDPFADIQAIKCASSRERKWQLCQQFLNKYGTHVITTIDIFCGSVSKVFASLKQASSHQKFEHSGSISGSMGEEAGLGVAAKYLQAQDEKIAELSILYTQKIFPSGNPTEDWTDTLAKTALAKLESKAWTKVAEPKVIPAKPEDPKYPKPTKKAKKEDAAQKYNELKKQLENSLTEGDSIAAYHFLELLRNQSQKSGDETKQQEAEAYRNKVKSAVETKIEALDKLETRISLADIKKKKPENKPYPYQANFQFLDFFAFKVSAEDMGRIASIAKMCHLKFVSDTKALFDDLAEKDLDWYKTNTDKDSAASIIDYVKFFKTHLLLDEDKCTKIIDCCQNAHPQSSNLLNAGPGDEASYFQEQYLRFQMKEEGYKDFNQYLKRIGSLKLNTIEILNEIRKIESTVSTSQA